MAETAQRPDRETVEKLIEYFRGKGGKGKKPKPKPEKKSGEK